MPKWASIVLIIVVFFAVAAILERRRLTALEAWCRANGFTSPLAPFVPGDQPHVPLVAAQVTGRDSNSLTWASVIAGKAGNASVTFAEFRYTPLGRNTSVWFTIAVWPSPADPGPVLTENRRRVVEAWPKGGQFALTGGYAGWMSEGLLSPSLADRLVAQVGEASRALE